MQGPMFQHRITGTKNMVSTSLRQVILAVGQGRACVCLSKGKLNI